MRHCRGFVQCGNAPLCVACWARRSNVLALREHGVHATHVPLGFARNLALPPPLPEAQRDIDVLFFGSVSTARLSPLCTLLPSSR